MAEPVDTSQLFRDARTFLSELAQNNSRAWFSGQKDRYDAQLKRPAERLLADGAQMLAGQLGHPPRSKLFRPHRDMRFTEDKTPYHAHLHMMWSLPDGRAWMLGIAPDYATLGCGIMTLTPAQSDRLARDATLPALVCDYRAGGWRLDPQPDSDTEDTSALHGLSGLVLWADDLDADPDRAPLEVLDQTFETAAPLMQALRQIA